MKKSVLLALAALAVSGTALAQEVVYEPDCSQGLLLNANKNNWFITAEGGTNILFSKYDISAPLKDRWGGNAALYFGKWVTPNFGFRFGANWMISRGATNGEGAFTKYSPYAEPRTSYDGRYEERFMSVGPEFDVMINLTNWLCGYKPNRVYNLVLHGGAGAYWNLGRNYGTEPKAEDNLKWRNAHNTVLFANAGLQNNFRLSNVVDLFFDIQYTLIDFSPAINHSLGIYAGLTFNLGKSNWDCPVTAICPTWKYTDAEGDALVAKLNAADRKIADLQQQLDACLKRPTAAAKVEYNGALATVYYPINQYGLSSREKTILKSVAAVMNENTDKKYVLTGWADNYTGTDEINARLREQRVNGVKNFLLNCGVNADQLDVKTNDRNLTDYGVKSAPLDRAVTIEIAD